MDIQAVADKKELAYMLIQQQRVLAQTQRNCQLLEQRINELELADATQEARTTQAAAEEETKTKRKS